MEKDLKDSFYNNFENAVTKERLSVYKADGADNKTALARYLYNIELCTALYPSLNMFEISFRNSVDKALQTFTGTAEWYNCINLSSESLNKINSAKRKIQNCGKQVTHDRVISELTLGFWTSLFSRKYNQEKFQPYLIKQCFKKALKNLKSAIPLWQYLDKFRYLRNRVFHYERLVHWKDLNQQHENLVNCISWFSDESYKILLKIDRFGGVYKKGQKKSIRLVKWNFNK